ncbi:ejaculatory bulb-specific protein 3 [Plodia interpunctella]|uniref:ejaculatory bulb-specific protein 3 n=1 Tax=Plodia interpunctella TaxID=58824 RepID=UPI002367EE7A|nr:ejaculatory bulb-specific protein 3-like [Plodia interpunctella]XP_053615080.1 ejaculatory bulb-specific protein 3-like [Plodia interpunctella]
MRTVILVCLLAVAALARPEKEYYTDKYDNIDLDEILDNRRLLIPYIKCSLDQGKCSADGREMKSHIRDAMETECSKCTKKQKKNTRKILRHLIIHEKDFWEQLKAKYDPTAKYYPTYEHAVEIDDKAFFGEA